MPLWVLFGQVMADEHLIVVLLHLVTQGKLSIWITTILTYYTKYCVTITDVIYKYNYGYYILIRDTYILKSHHCVFTDSDRSVYTQ